MVRMGVPEQSCWTPLHCGGGNVNSNWSPSGDFGGAAKAGGMTPYP